MSRSLDPVAKRTLVTGLLALAISIAGLVGGPGSASATLPAGVEPMVDVPFVGRVVDGSGDAQRAAAVVACPYVGAAADCSQAIRQAVGPSGVAVLSLNPAVRYRVLAVVTNPMPEWPCPGLPYGNDMLYLSAESLDGTPRELPRIAKFTVIEPTAANCVTVRVTDDIGTPIPHAGLFIDAGYSNGQTDANGTIRMQVTPGTTYDMGAFVADTGWPCPSWVGPDGTQLHIANRRPVTAEELLAGMTFVIHKPDASECVPVPTAEIRMVDESGAPLPAAFVSTCGYDASTPPMYEPGTTNVCSPDSGWEGPDGDGVIRVPVADPTLMYDITGFLSCTNGWYLFGEFNNTLNGYTFWTISGADLLANGLELTIIGDVEACLAPVAAGSVS
jgi:hypothetical protein